MMSEQSNLLLSRLKRLIEQAGPITLADYMQLSLADPAHGYYANRNAIGGKGDFITAPEVSQMFGELTGIWVIAVWQMIGRPSPFSLVEFGPGTGALMKDILRTLRSDPACSQAAVLMMVEASPAMIERQQAAIGKEGAQWIGGMEDLPEHPVIAVANEFLDALPTRQFVRKADHWAEIGITMTEDDKLERIALPASISTDWFPEAAGQHEEGAVFEYSPAREAFVEALATQIVEKNGAALFYDYGHLQSGYGDTFQAVRNHAFADPLTHPGKSDLTIHVDFERLAKAAGAAGIINPQLAEQGNFLLAMGLLERAGTLGHGKSFEVQEAIRDAVERLAAPEAMGRLFKVFGFSSPPCNLPGFSDNAPRET